MPLTSKSFNKFRFVASNFVTLNKDLVRGVLTSLPSTVTSCYYKMKPLFRFSSIFLLKPNLVRTYLAIFRALFVWRERASKASTTLMRFHLKTRCFRYVFTSQPHCNDRKQRPSFSETETFENASESRDI